MQNEMMHRPVVKPELVEYMRTNQKQLAGKLGALEKEANEKGIPIIPHETVVFMQYLLKQLQPKKILEVGTAIGFSASLMALLSREAHITTIDRYDLMIKAAKENIAALGLNERITLLEGQASEILPSLASAFDFIFMDSAKAKYLDFLPDCLRLLTPTGTLMVDDVFQGGTILADDAAIPRKNRAIHRKLNAFLDTVHEHPQLESSLLPLGDGVILITKKAGFTAL